MPNAECRLWSPPGLVPCPSSSVASSRVPSSFLTCRRRCRRRHRRRRTRPADRRRLPPPLPSRRRASFRCRAVLRLGSQLSAPPPPLTPTTTEIVFRRPAPPQSLSPPSRLRRCHRQSRRRHSLVCGSPPSLPPFLVWQTPSSSLVTKLIVVL